jgi:hypothetical protein
MIRGSWPVQHDPPGVRRRQPGPFHALPLLHVPQGVLVSSQAPRYAIAADQLQHDQRSA